MLALAQWRDGLCPVCQRPLEECADPKADGGYSVPPPTRCHATTAVQAAAAKYQDSETPSALLFRAERRA